MNLLLYNDMEVHLECICKYLCIRVSFVWVGGGSFFAPLPESYPPWKLSYPYFRFVLRAKIEYRNELNTYKEVTRRTCVVF